MDDNWLQRLIFLIALAESSVGNPTNYDMFYDDDDGGLSLDPADVEQFRSLWETNHPEMHAHEAYGKGERGAAASPDRNDTAAPPSSSNHNAESWSLVLYLICFLVLIVFFFIISAMEVCCKRGMLDPPAGDAQSAEPSPPPYDLFAPPAYDSLYDAKCEKKSKQRRKCSIFVIHLPKRKITFDLTRVRTDNSSSAGIEVRDEISPPPPP